MPFNELKDLLFNIEEIIRTSDLSNEEMKVMARLSASLGELIEASGTVLEASKGKNEPINSLDAAALSKKYSDFVEESKKVSDAIKKNGMDDPILTELVAPIDTLALPLTQYAEALKNPEERSLTTIFKDLSWVGKLLGQDPNSLPKVKDDQAASEAQEFGQIDNIEKGMRLYKLSANEAEQKYNAHYSKLVGSENITEALEYKCKLVASAVEQIYGNTATAQEIKRYPQQFKRVEEAFVMGKQTGKLSPLNERKFNKLSMVFDAPTFEGNGKAEGISDENVSILTDFLSKLNPRSYLLGISEQQLEILGQTSVLMTQMEDIKEGFRVRDNNLNLVNGLKLPELKGLKDAIDAFDKKAFDYVVKGEGEPPAAEDVGLIMDSISTYMNGKFELNDVGKIGIFETCYTLAKGISTYAAGFDDKFNEVKEKYNNIVLSEFERQKELVKSGPIEDIEKLMDSIVDLSNTEANIPQDEYDKVYKIALLRSPDFREKQYKMAMSQLNSIKDKDNYSLKDLKFAPVNRSTWKELPKNELVKKIGQVVAVCEFAGKQEEKIINYKDAIAQGLPEGAANGYNEAFYESVMAENLSEEQVQALEDIVDGINDNPKLNEIFNAEPKQIAGVLTNEKRKNLDSLLHGNEKFNIFAGMQETDIPALLEDRKLHKDSDSFKALRDSITDLNKAKENIGGVETEDYIKVYKSALNYLNKHDSNPKTNWGKERFDAAAKLMANVGVKLAKECPDMREEIEKSFQITMIRSENFREYMVGKLVNDKTVEPGFRKEMFDSAALIAESLKEDYGKTMIECNPSKVKEAPKLYEIYTNIMEGDRALNRRYPDVQKEEFKKQDEGMSMQ